MSDRPTLVLVGGFLGAGKTTLLIRAARLLLERGLRAAIITNDQAGALVDTRMAAASGFDTTEVAGACFCCRFGDFIAAAKSLLAIQPDVIFAEPVGSCMDLSATVLQPLKELHATEFRLAPYTVLIDPQQAEGFEDPLLNYLYQNQINEADLLVYTKSDLNPQPPAPSTQNRRVSALSGEGVAAWLDEVLNGRLRAGTHLLDIDYARYAAAEASLGWLNWEAELKFAAALPPAAVVGPLLEDLDAELTAAAVPIAHLKIFDRTPGSYIRVGICRNGGEPSIEGDLLATPARHHELIVNLRAHAVPAVLDEVMARTTRAIPGRLRVRHHQSFQPSPPVPTYRYDKVSP